MGEPARGSLRGMATGVVSIDVHSKYILRDCRLGAERSPEYRSPFFPFYQYIGHSQVGTGKGGVSTNTSSIHRGFKTRLPVYKDGIVIEYPQFFERIWSP